MGHAAIINALFQKDREKAAQRAEERRKKDLEKREKKLKDDARRREQLQKGNGKVSGGTTTPQ